MAELGKIDSGSSGHSVLDARFIAYRVTLTETATVNFMRGYFRYVNSSDRTFIGTIHDSNGDLVASSDPYSGSAISEPAAQATVTFPSAVVLSPGDYWLGAHMSATGFTVLSSDTSDGVSRENNAAYPSAPANLLGLTARNDELALYLDYTPASAGLAIDSEPSETRATESFTITASNPATTPTTGNTTLQNGATSIAPDSVTGSDPYVLTFTIPRTAPLLFSQTGYVWTVDIDGETVDTDQIPYLPETGKTFVTLGASPSTAAGAVLAQFNPSDAQQGDQIVYDLVTSPGSVGITVADDSEIILDSDPGIDQTFNVYIIDSAPTVTVGAIGSITVDLTESANIVFNTPESRITLSGFDDTQDLRFEVVVAEMYPVGGSNNQINANSIFADDGLGASATFGDLPGSSLFTTNCTVRINDVVASTVADFIALAEDDVLEVEVAGANNSGTVYLLANKARSTFLAMAAKEVRIRDTSDTLLHSFALNAVDFDTGVVPDGVGSAVCTLTGFRAEGNAIQTGSIPASAKAGAELSVTVDDAYKYDEVQLDGLPIPNLSVTDRNTLDADLPEDGFDPLNGNTISLNEANPFPISKAMLFDQQGEIFTTSDTRYLYNNGSAARQPVQDNDSVIRFLGVSGKHKLLPEVVTNSAIYTGGRLRANSGAHIFHVAPNIDPSVNGVTVLYVSRHKGTGNLNEPDFLWSGPLDVSEHGPIKLIMRNGRTKLSWSLTDNEADEFELITETGNERAYCYALTFDPNSSEAIAYLNGTANVTRTVVGTVPIMDDCSAITGDRAGITHDLVAYGVIDRVLSPVEISNISSELLTAATIDDVDYDSSVPLASPSISVQPQDQAGIGAGANAVFTVSGSSYNAVQWYKKTASGTVTALGTATTQSFTTSLADNNAEVWAVLIRSSGVAVASRKASLGVVDLDTTAPVITLTGPALIELNVGDSYTEQGATASDDTDGDITGDISVTGDTVDTNAAGTYIVRYNVSDAAGNAATEVTRTVNVVADSTIPVITLLGNASITISVGDAFVDAGATAVDDIDGDITGDIVVSGDTVDTNAAGTYVIRYNVSDSAGNAANEVTRTVVVEAAGAFDWVTFIQGQSADDADFFNMGTNVRGLGGGTPVPTLPIQDFVGIKGNIFVAGAFGGTNGDGLFYDTGEFLKVNNDTLTGIAFLDMDPGTGVIDPETGSYSLSMAIRQTGQLNAQVDFMRLPSSRSTNAGSTVGSWTNDSRVRLSIGSFLQAYLGSSLIDNQWHTVGMVWDLPAGTIRYYFDGVLVLNIPNATGFSITHLNGIQVMAHGRGGFAHFARITYIKEAVTSEQMLGAHTALLA